MKGNRVDQFMADDSFVYQLAFSLNAETHVKPVENADPEPKKPEQETAKKAKPAAPSNSTETKVDEDTVHIDL